MNKRRRRQLEACQQRLQLAIVWISRALDDPDVLPDEEHQFYDIAETLTRWTQQRLAYERDQTSRRDDAPLRRPLPSRTPTHRLRVLPNDKGGQ